MMGQWSSLHQTSHFFFGFMYDPSLHLNTSENSWKFDKVPITLQNKRISVRVNLGVPFPHNWKEFMTPLNDINYMQPVPRPFNPIRARPREKEQD